MKKLTRVEEEVMQVIWSREKCLLSDIVKDLNREEAPLSTVSSVVRILVKKGFLTYKKYGRTYEYYPKVSKKEYTGKSLRSLVNNYFDGSMKNLVSFIIHEKDLDSDELTELLSNYRTEEE